MRARFEFTPKRLAAWAEMTARGLTQVEIARELGCGVHTLIRHKHKSGGISTVKQRAGRIGMSRRYRLGSEASP